MSTLFMRGNVYYVGVPTHPDGWVKRSTGTGNKALASSMARMMDELGPKGRRAWSLIDPVIRGELAVARLHDAFARGPAVLDALTAELKDVDAEIHVKPWLASLVDHIVDDTIQHYGTHVRSLIPEGARFPLSRITRVELAHWMNTRKGSPGTKRKYRAAMSSFCTYLVGLDMLSVNPMLQVKPPKATAPRMRYLNHEQELELVEAQPEPFRTISALMHATGMEISAVLKVSRADVDTDTWMVRAHGTKTASRDRHVYVKEWARPYLLRHMGILLPGGLLFPGITRWAPSESHNRACRKLGIEDYTLRDSRHTFAVAAAKAGIPAEFISRQLGHSDTQMVNKVYSRFEPSRAEIAKIFERADHIAYAPATV